eukprot:scaffold14511_cov23-Tisochrysis_lutea.AAC.1
MMHAGVKHDAGQGALDLPLQLDALQLQVARTKLCNHAWCAQVSSMLLGKEPVIYRCSKTRYSFMWRQADLKALFDRGFKLEEVEMLADHSMRF